MARKNYREYLRGDTVRLKKYLYVLRPLLATLWTLMKDARRGLHSLVEDILPAGRLLEFIEHSPAQVLNLCPPTQPSHDTWRNGLAGRIDAVQCE
jgi:hypothetical protein